MSDQDKVNAVLYDLQVQWKHIGQYNSSVKKEVWIGMVKDGIQIVVLPLSVVYRQPCKYVTEEIKMVDSLYVWHYCSRLSEDGKLDYASQTGLWHLREDWETFTMATSTVGEEWLKSIAVQ